MNTLTLSQPKIIDGPELRDVRIRVAPDFRPFIGDNRLNWLVKVNNATRIENVSIMGHDGGWLHQWDVPIPDADHPLPPDPEPGISPWLGGLLVDGLRDGVLSDVSVYGLPGRPVQVNGAENAATRRIMASRCFSGLKIDGALNVDVEDVTVGDCWMPAAQDSSSASEWSRWYRDYYDTGDVAGLCGFPLWTGDNILVVANATIIRIRRVNRMPGTEGKGMKLSSVLWGLVEHCRPGGTIQVNGLHAPGKPTQGKLSNAILIRDCDIDLMQGARLRPRYYDGIHAINGALNVWVQRCRLHGGGEGRYGIHANHGSQVTVTDTVAAGWEETFKEKDGGRVKWV